MYLYRGTPEQKKRGTYAAPLRGTGIPIDETGKPTLYDDSIDIAQFVSSILENYQFS